MSKILTKNSEGFIENPVDAEDFAYNIAHDYELTYPAQVEIEAALNALATAGDVATRAAIIDDILSSLQFLKDS